MDERASQTRLRKARQELFMALDQIQYGASQWDVVMAIEEYSMALISEAFAKHPVTKSADSADGDKA